MSAVVLPCCLLLQLAAAVTHGGCGNQRGFLEGWAREEMCGCHWQLCLVGAGLTAGSKVRPFDLGREVTLTGVISPPSCPEEGFPRSCHQLPVELSGRTHRSGSSRAVCLGSLCFFNYLEQSVNYKKERPRGYSFPYQCTKPRDRKILTRGTGSTLKLLISLGVLWCIFVDFSWVKYMLSACLWLAGRQE